MGLMDKVKTQASQIADRAQEAGKVGQAKIEALQAKRKADALLERVGRLTYLAGTGRGQSSTDDTISDLFAQLKTYEDQFGAISADSSGESAPDPSSWNHDGAAEGSGDDSASNAGSGV